VGAEIALKKKGKARVFRVRGGVRMGVPRESDSEYAGFEERDPKEP
jgi:hypothetical protein